MGEGKKENGIDREKLVFLTAGELQEIYENAASIGAREAMKTLEQERKRAQAQRADKRLRNTKLLLRNYHMLKAHAESSVFGRTQMEESAADILESMMSIYSDDVVIQSIKNSATRTAIIVAHIETMLGLYHVCCEKAANREIEMRRHDTLWDMYIAEEPLSASAIAEKRNISIRNVYEDIRIATERLSALIFGVDGLYVH